LGILPQTTTKHCSPSVFITKLPTMSTAHTNRKRAVKAAASAPRKGGTGNKAKAKRGHEGDENDVGTTPKRANTGQRTNRPALAAGGNQNDVEPLGSDDLHVTSVELEKSKAANAALQEQLNDTSDSGKGDDSREQIVIAKPKGTAGTNYSIQVEMGLWVRQRVLHDLTLASCVNWELPWPQIPMRDKANQY